MTIQPPPPLLPCAWCDRQLTRIGLVAGPHVREQRTALATDLIVHRQTEDSCPNRNNPTIPVPSYDGTVGPCLTCAHMRIITATWTSDPSGRNRGQRELAIHQTREDCPARIPAEAAIA